MLYKAVKRFLDIFFSFILLIILLPIMLLTALAIKIDSRGPVLFRQERLGYRKKVFRMIKFRSMQVNSEKTGSGVYSAKGDPRVTRVGRIIRATSLDELPQLINILLGEMSFIGPRPPLTYHPWPLEQYTDEQLRMFDVRPGLSGWAQVHGRKHVEWNERIRLNVWYVDHISFWLDIKIFFLTIKCTFSASNNENVGQTVINSPQKLSEK